MVQKQDDIEKTMKILKEQTANIDATDCQNIWSARVRKEKTGTWNHNRIPDKRGYLKV